MARTRTLCVVTHPDGIAEGRRQSWLDERFVFPPKPDDVSGGVASNGSGGERMLDHQARLDHDEGIEGAETRRSGIYPVSR